MPTRPPSLDAPLFDAVLFDLDGTLVATDRFWLQAARAGTRRALGELGIDRPLPDRAAWLGLIGKDIRLAFGELFPELNGQQVAHVLACVEQEERRLIDGGGAAPMPGAVELLGALSAAGLRLGVASNCSAAYLRQILDRLDLARWFDDAYCLDTPGIDNKAQMIERHLQCFGTRSAVMVGDRLGDRDAAWRNGVPHVHCRFGFAGRETVQAEGSIDDLGELAPLLAGRGQLVADALAALGVRPGAGIPRPMSVGVNGARSSGKTLFARDAARWLRARDVPAVALSLEAFRRVDVAPDACHVEQLYDVDRLDRELFEPLGEGREARLDAGLLLDAPYGDRVPGEALVLLAGTCLFEARLHSRLTRVLHLTADDAVRARRELARANQAGPSQRAGRPPVLTEGDAARRADHCVDVSSPFGRTE